AIITCIVLACVLPPSALFSYIFARHTTRRIEKLAAATSAIRAGDYTVRVSVEGEDEIARLQADFNVMATELERTLRELQEERDTVSMLLHARRELIATVSHELRTPVATVRSYLEATLSNWGEQPPPALRQDLHIMEQQTIRLQSLIDDLFTLARAEVKRLELRCVPTNVELLVTRVVEMMAPIAWRRSRVEVLADTSAAVSPFPLALIDGKRLEQVLQNLLHNAIRHTPPGGIVIVSLGTEAAMLLVQVKDTGEGIPAQEIPRIWERFYRTESALRHPDSGTGLGLAIVKELTEAMGGTASVMSVLGQGTCFTLQFPLAPPSARVENPPLSVSRSRIHT
ncbi:MAG TPA: ATP-binding protein, partial [Ktedonobacteraceae bacterium]|nr:ATP-binding protein [Ktedonobacteraceae bacterium]